VERYRQVHRYAEAHGFVSGFPDFEQDLDGAQQLRFGNIFLHATVAERRVVKARDLGNPSADNVGERFRAAHRYTTALGFVGGFPDYEQSLDVDNDLVYGTILLRNTGAQRRIVRATALGNPRQDDIGERVRAAHRYAVANGFVSGFPNFEQSLDAGNLVYGIIVVSGPVAERRVLHADALDLCGRFGFEPSITCDQRNKLLERHCFAVSRISGCGNLTNRQKDDLRNAYRQSIKHGSSTRPGVNASVPTGGPDARRRINVNFGVLFSQGDDEIAQTLIHEMMHCAEHDHPDRQPTDGPFDGGPYYGSPPLQAEICIAGGQSLALAGRQQARECSLQNGEFAMCG
jgi:hypothetical protein